METTPKGLQRVPGKDFLPYRRDERFRDDGGPLKNVRGTPESIQSFGESPSSAWDQHPPAPARADFVVGDPAESVRRPGNMMDMAMPAMPKRRRSKKG